VVQRNLAISAAAEQRAIAGEAVHNQPPKQEVSAGPITSKINSCFIFLLIHDVSFMLILVDFKVVHKQFNSPLALYSEENVKEVMALQSGLIP